MLHKSISDHDLLLFDTDGTYLARWLGLPIANLVTGSARCTLIRIIGQAVRWSRHNVQQFGEYRTAERLLESCRPRRADYH